MKFELENAVVEGDVSIADIYNKIKEENESLLNEIIEEKERKIILNMDIEINIENVEFKGKFNMEKFHNFEIKKNVIPSFNKELSFYEITFDKFVGFYGVLFNEYANFSKAVFEEDVNFKFSTFNGEAYFKDTKFNKQDMTNQGKTDFNGTTFEKYATFENAQFEGRADFNEVKFKENTDFSEAIFNDETHFYNAKFNMDTKKIGTANFTHTQFKKYAEFTSALFNKKVGFYHNIFEEEINFTDTKFKGRADFGGVIFKGKVGFNYSIFLDIVEFSDTTFEGEVDFKKAIFNKLKCSESTFKSRAYFEDIFFNLLSFVKCGFRDTTSFKKETLTDEKVKELNKEEITEIENYENLAIFNFVRFDEYTTIDNFQLSKTSFLRTDVRKVMLTEYFEDENFKEILSHKLLTNRNNNKGIYEKAYKILEKQLNNHISVLAEYRNLRLSIEDNITYEEASNLYKMEMGLKKKYSKNNFEKIAIILYGILSDYGESVEKSILWGIFAITSLPVIALACKYFSITIVGLYYLVKDIILLLILTVIIMGLIAYGVLATISWDYNTTTTKLGELFTKFKTIIGHICGAISSINPKLFPYAMFFLVVGIFYVSVQYYVSLLDTITVFFQLGINTTTAETNNPEHIMKNWELPIRIISLILLGNLYIALRRRLSRK
ncbi:pentapeptide repeat-containing protein [Methanococcus aeolicus]|uniref:Pentapeptide repeat protein n=1 Tax=Methanococcus aeolicus (strain ATCC BAA-1280 / DSM 17508 / OCM 812 / Nankai-3) TaxID=419665 RepID=A6UVV6_META3|nr:pentapeptide repeat-containing protein [Methanococcus aeolicus]ABR56628.1 hypothetical protein Maeo_1050 [Methanococcus aeolicus Nankai-3]UXM84631.1 pentapeptide repeat-containing protein [Methanococcus aeolicus]